MIKLYLDPGHGGIDPGAIGNGLQEKDLTLAIATRMKSMLNGYSNVSVRMSRATDQTVSLSQRTDDANQWGADYFISIHINAGGGTGYEDFIYNQLPSGSKTTQMRRTMHEHIIKQVNLIDRGMKQANFYVLRETRMPAILTENGFIDHKSDAALMKTDTWLEAVALGHVNGLVELFNLATHKNAVKEPSKPNKQVQTDYTGISIVDYLNQIGQDSSFSNRAKLARQFGIVDYRGTAEQNLNLLAMLQSNHKSVQVKGDLETDSIVDYLNSIGSDSSFAHRKELAKRHGITNYRGSAEQNIQLLRLIRATN